MASIEIVVKLSRSKIERWISQFTGAANVSLGVSHESPKFAVIAFLVEHGVPEAAASEFLRVVQPETDDLDTPVLIAHLNGDGEGFRRTCVALNELAN